MDWSWLVYLFFIFIYFGIGVYVILTSSFLFLLSFPPSTALSCLLSLSFHHSFSLLLQFIGLAITTATAFSLFRNGTATRLMAANPWVVMGGGLILSIGSMMGVFYTAPDTIAHKLCWATFSAVQGTFIESSF